MLSVVFRRTFCVPLVLGPMYQTMPFLSGHHKTRDILDAHRPRVIRASGTPTVQLVHERAQLAIKRLQYVGHDSAASLSESPPCGGNEHVLVARQARGEIVMIGEDHRI